jgi:hypothetical protein
MVALSRALCFAAAIVVALPGCKKKDEPLPVVKTESAPETPVPAPDALMVEAVVRSPDAMIQSFRTITPMVPERVAPVLADVLHVSRETTDEVDGTKPAYFVLVRRNNESQFVFALHLRDAGKVLAELGNQGLARTEDPSQGLSIFEAGQAAPGPRGQVLGVRRNFLIAASTVTALKELTPFATRTMPTRPVPKEEVMMTFPRSAMRGPIRDALNAAIMSSAARRKDLLAKGDAGPPRAIGAMDAIGEYASRSNERLVSFLADAGDGHVAITTVAGSISIRSDVEIDSMESPFGKAVTTWPVGDATAALNVPAGALLAFAGRSSESARAESSKDFVDMLATMYPEDVGPKERTKVEEFLAAWDKARSELTSGALLYEGPARIAVALRLGAKDPAALAKLTREALTAILAIKGVNQGLTKEGVGAPKWSEATLGGTHVDVLAVNMPRKPGDKPKPGEPETADVVFGVVPGSSEIAIVAGVGSRDLFASVVEAKGANSLHGSAPLEAHVKGLGGALAGFAVAMPSRMLPLASGSPVLAPTPPSDPISLSIGRGAKGPYVAIDITRPAVELAGKFLVKSMLK